MYFKQLEMCGFKSFADRTVVRLEPGVTAVVGPNGCGKSNILDALRWSLGEQRARELRGTHMMDIIFNGSENRQPMGMAEVSVTFDNSESKLPVDFAEVQVTRRLYRSGESEYFINKAPCRLRDIHELFMDTGIGTAAYSIIGQGQIDLVLSSKPEDRRFLFEEAAGIIKYKARKRVAMRKMETADQNLLRLSDIIAEVQRQMRSLKRQVNAAIRYREMKEALRDLEIRFVWTKYTGLQEQIGSLKQTFADAQDTYEKSLAESTRLDARAEELAFQRLELERVLEARRGDVYEIDGEMEKTERQIALFRQQIEFLKEQQQQALRDHEELQERAAAIQAQIALSGEAVQTAQAEIESCNEEIARKQEEHEHTRALVAEAESRLEAVRARTVETMNDRAKMQTELETLSVNIRNIDSQLTAIYDRQNTLHSRHEEVVTRLQELRTSHSNTQGAADETAATRAKTAAERADKAQQLRTLHDTWQTVREAKSSHEARLGSLRELRDSYEGFATGVRAVMMAKQKKQPEAQGVIGPVGDLLSTQKTYERAIEAALGGNINNVVVENAEAAKSAIAFLKRERAGRVTFLPLDTIRSSQNDDTGSLLGRPGVVGLAIAYVSFDPHVKKAMDYLFHNTVIVETLDDAIRIARSESRFPRMVTLDGEYVSPAGAVTGGQTQSESRGLIGRSAEIAELEQRVAEADERIKELAAQGEALTDDMRGLSAQLDDLEKQEKAFRDELNDLGVQIARFSTELENLTQSNDQFKEQCAALEAERQALEEQRKEALARADSMEQDDAALERERAEAQDAVLRARQALSARAEDLANLRVRFAELTQRVEEGARNQQREQREYEETLQNAARRLEQNEQFKENEAGLNNEIALQLERVKALSEGKEEARKKVVAAQEQMQTLLQEADAATKSTREIHEQVRASQADMHRLEIELRHNEDQLQFLTERVLTEYHVALASLDAEQIGTDEHDDETREAMVTDLREKLDRMGQVNLMAIEEYEALEKRNAFLVSQEEDLRKARETLLGIVARIDSTIREMFLQTFNDVSENFRVFFRRLFNGGQARVYLLDESDPLECGIEIEARPPGKKPQSISLLSGGEQAMTAISLLFAIFKAKPSPFCVLDEVDAPLDDANIGRFLALVDEFKAESQFIIITHNKQTMAKANVMHGVTMQERGVSQLVSVRFDEAPENAA